MKFNLNYPFTCVFLSLQVVAIVSSNKISLFEDNTFNRLLFRYKLDSENCITLPTHLQGTAGSIITESCILIYVRTDCTGTSIKIDHLKNRGQYGLYDVQHSPEEHFGRRVKSFRRCTKDEGGDSLNVDFYAGNDATTPAYQYTDICECMNVPSLGANFAPLRRINNYGNCVMLYTSLDCTGQKFEIKGGISTKSENLGQLSSTFNSVSPCGNYKDRCVSLTATVTRFKILSNETRIQAQSSFSNVAMTAKTTFRNNGSAVVSQEYSAKKQIREVVETTRAHTSSSFHEFNVGASVTTEFTAGLPFIAKTKISATLSFAYTYQTSQSSTEESTFTYETTVEYATNQKIEINPCNEYEVSSYITVLENYPLDYEVYFAVSGVSRDGARLEVENLKQRLGSLDFIETRDNYTVIAKGYGSIVSSIGLEAVIDGEGKPILNCIP